MWYVTGRNETHIKYNWNNDNIQMKSKATELINSLKYGKKR